MSRMNGNSMRNSTLTAQRLCRLKRLGTNVRLEESRQISGKKAKGAM
jgi:hypothetical protein